ncbi:kinase-like protein [Thelephora ganbajun]|uniref:Kinase-like protein n=1 Tax=Thelephora ganbajun TaxID=370292 RepID=A0ACB6Z5Z6_THEGA|nr:kinase-like protein [Thelephora ganbajun]
MDPPQTSSSANDIFSLSDQTLADRLQFIEEIGYGNWGSVWRCCPKPDPSSKSPPNKYEKVKLAVKLVHRSKTQTTAARIRSLWNEMKIVRSLKNEIHPSIIPFYSFIITPSYALITMAYLPRLIPVEVDESIARVWFKSLLGGIEFLHIRGVVHNDIKPANILLSDKDVPVLVDFGFAEKYDLGSSKAFRSNLAYGTPEYLSPERARGHHHDTRKSDVWSLGVTFFEILIGRTPFEYVEGEQFSTKEDLEKYWTRTVRGKWVGSYKMSRGVEKLIRRMVSPNADVRCFASEALDDPYWVPREVLKAVQKAAHRMAIRSISFHASLTILLVHIGKSASLSQAALSAMNIDVDASRLLDIVSPFTTRTLKDRKSSNKENLTKNVSSAPTRKSNIRSDFVMVESSEILKRVKIKAADQSSSLSSAASSSKNKHARSQSQPKVAVRTGLLFHFFDFKDADR